MTLQVKYDDFQQIMHAASGQHPVADVAELEGRARGLLRGVLPPRRPVRLLGVTLSRLVPVSAVDARPAQLPLLG